MGGGSQHGLSKSPIKMRALPQLMRELAAENSGFYKECLDQK